MNTELTTAPPKELSRETSNAVSWAKALTIRTQSDYDAAVSHLQVIKSLTKRAIEFFRPMKQRADDAKRSILEAEREITNPLAEAEAIAKRTILDFTQAQERERQIEERRLQAIADEKARKERERLEAAAAKLKTPERKEEKLAAAAAVIAPVVTVEQKIVTTPAAASRTIWKARVVNAELIPRSFLIVNEKALDSFAKNTKGKSSVLGVEFYSEEILAVGATKSKASSWI